MPVAFVHYHMLLDCASLIHVDYIPLFAIHVWHPCFSLNGKRSTWLDITLQSSCCHNTGTKAKYRCVKSAVSAFPSAILIVQQYVQVWGNSTTHSFSANPRVLAKDCKDNADSEPISELGWWQTKTTLTVNPPLSQADERLRQHWQWQWTHLWARPMRACRQQCSTNTSVADSSRTSDWNNPKLCPQTLAL